VTYDGAHGVSAMAVVIGDTVQILTGPESRHNYFECVLRGSWTQS
jgi:hypothetical protein